MKTEFRKTTEIKNCIIHFRQAPRGWAIIVMPEGFRVDNYYHGVHVHPDKSVIPIKDPIAIYKIIYNHISKENRLIESKLRKELGL